MKILIISFNINGAIYFSIVKFYSISVKFSTKKKKLILLVQLYDFDSISRQNDHRWTYLSHFTIFLSNISFVKYSFQDISPSESKWDILCISPLPRESTFSSIDIIDSKCSISPMSEPMKHPAANQTEHHVKFRFLWDIIRSRRISLSFLLLG